MRSQYKLTINSKGANAIYMITYMNGRFKKLEHKSGKLVNQDQHDKLMKLCPEIDKAILFLQQNFTEVTWERIVNDKDNASLFKRCMDFYSNWYQDKNAFAPRINGAEANALKLTIAYIQKESATEAEVIAVFESIFHNWENYSTFYQGQMDLKQINSNLNTLLRIIKNGTSSSTAKNSSETLRDKFKQ